MATIRKRKDKYQVQIRRKEIRPLSKSFLLRKDAETWARTMELRADRSDLPDDPKALEKITLGQIVVRYRDTVSIRKKRADNERIELSAFLRHSICSRRLSELRTADFADYRDQRLRQVKPTTLKRQLGPIRHMFEIARLEWGIPLRENPLSRLQLNAPDQRRERRLKAGELDKLLTAAQSCRNLLVAPIIEFALETAMRRGEILAIRWGDIDFERQRLAISTTKNGLPRTIPLTAKAIALLQAQRRTTDRVFPITAMALRLAWERLRRRAGLTDLHFHDLRHEAISRFFERRLTVPEAALISGHRDLRMLLRYSHGQIQEVAAKLNQK